MAVHLNSTSGSGQGVVAIFLFSLLSVPFMPRGSLLLFLLLFLPPGQLVVWILHVAPCIWSSVKVERLGDGMDGDDSRSKTWA